jgi:predicted transposase YdaD
MLGLNLTEEPRAIREAKDEGREEEARSLILRLLRKKLGDLTPAMGDRVSALSFAQIEQLGEALLDFSSVQDLDAWFVENS